MLAQPETRCNERTLPDMSYATIYRSVQDAELRPRITACAKQENRDTNGAIEEDMYWAVAGAADVEAAYASALAAGNEHPGGDEAVITDQMILSHVQAFTPPP
jgi:hypothetical protein